MCTFCCWNKIYFEINKVTILAKWWKSVLKKANRWMVASLRFFDPFSGSYFVSTLPSLSSSFSSSSNLWMNASKRCVKMYVAPKAINIHGSIRHVIKCSNCLHTLKYRLTALRKFSKCTTKPIQISSRWMRIVVSTVDCRRSF